MSDSICMASEYWTRFHSIFVKNLIVQSNIKKYWIKRKLWGNQIFHEVLRFLTSLFRFVIHFTYIKTKTKNNDFPMFSTPNINILIRYVVILLFAWACVCNTLMRDQWFNQFFDSCINAWAMFMTTFCITQKYIFRQKRYYTASKHISI